MSMTGRVVRGTARTMRGVARRVARLLPGTGAGRGDAPVEAEVLAAEQRRRARLEALARAVGLPVGGDMAAAVGEWMSGGQPERLWLAHAGLRGRYPDAEEVVATRRLVEREGHAAALEQVFGLPATDKEIYFLHKARLVDAGPMTTGDAFPADVVARTAGQLAARWTRSPGIVAVGWDPTGTGLRRRYRARAGRPGYLGRELVVPRGGTYVLTQPVEGAALTGRLGAMARFAGMRTVAVGHHCGPIARPDAHPRDRAVELAGYLAAVARMDLLVATSEAAAAQFQGWKRMLSAAGLTGPEIVAVPGPCETPVLHRPTFDAVRLRLEIGRLPTVVGLAGPAMDTGALLRAAEMAWRAGARFSLLLPGLTGRDRRRAEEAAAGGRLVDLADDLVPEDLHAVCAVAGLVAVPAVDEGAALLVAEALALGATVITSPFGSVAETVATATQTGCSRAHLADPRNPEALAAAIQRAVAASTGPLRHLPDGIAPRSWETVAAEVWAQVRP